MHGSQGTTGLWQGASMHLLQSQGVQGTGHWCCGQSQRGMYFARIQAMVISLQQSSTAALIIVSVEQPSSQEQVSPAQAASGKAINSKLSSRKRMA